MVQKWRMDRQKLQRIGEPRQKMTKILQKSPGKVENIFIFFTRDERKYAKQESDFEKYIAFLSQVQYNNCGSAREIIVTKQIES